LAAVNKDRESVHPVAGTDDVQIIKGFARDWTELISDDDADPR